MKRIKSVIASVLVSVANYFDAARRYTPDRSYRYADVQDARLDLTAADRVELVRKARDFECNNALVNRMADLFEQYTVGPNGLQIIPASSDETWNQANLIYWQGWQPYCDNVSLHGWSTIQSICSRRWFIEGEVFVLKTRGETFPSKPRIQLIEGHRVATPPHLYDQEGKTVTDGIAHDLRGRPTGYWVRDRDRDGLEKWTLQKAENVVHIFEPSRPGQYRGYPFIAPVLNDIHDLDDLQKLEMLAAKDAAEKSTVIYTENGEIDPDQLRREKYNQPTQTTAGVETTAERERYVKTAIGGRTLALKLNERMEQHRSERPSVATQGYWDFLTYKICAGSGITKQLVMPDRMQGTVARGDLDAADSFFQSRSAVLAGFFKEIYLFVTKEGGARESAVIQKLPADWRNTTARFPRSVNVDVGRNSAAMLAQLAAGATTFDDIYGPKGQDWRERLRAKAVQAKYIRDLAKEFELSPDEIAEMQRDSIVTDPNNQTQNAPTESGELSNA